MATAQSPTLTLDPACPSCRANRFTPLYSLRKVVTVGRCKGCGLYGASLKNPISNSEDEFADFELSTYFEAMKQIRAESSIRTLDCAERFCKPGKVLEIGCSFGWFLDEARNRGWKTFGIEPSRIAANVAKDHGHDVLLGSFPRIQPPKGGFDAVVMLDVLEHLTDVKGVLEVIHGLLRPEGLLILKVPNRRGVVFRAANILHRATWGAVDLPLWRLWQLDFAYPHLWYFDATTLSETVKNMGFDPLIEETEPIVTFKTIKPRIDYIASTGGTLGRRLGFLYRIGLTCCTAAARLGGADDILVSISRRLENKYNRTDRLPNQSH